jgi:hypothetical protein
MESNMSENTVKPEKKTKAPKAKKRGPGRPRKDETAAPAPVAETKKKRGWPKGKKRGPYKAKAGGFKIASFIRTAKRLEATRNKLARLEKELKKMAAQAAS